MKVEATFHGDRKVFSVSAFNQGVGIYLRSLPDLWIEGEVTELRRNEAWAFVFFTLEDPRSGACLKATMPRRRFDTLEFELTEGERVLVQGKAEIYPAKGELSFRVATIERLELEEIVAKLERGDAAVEEAIRFWQRGDELHRKCASLLEAADGRIEELSAGTDDNGARGL